MVTISAAAVASVLRAEYIPQSELDATELENWFLSPLQGLACSPKVAEALKRYGIDGPPDLFGMNETAIDSLNGSLRKPGVDENGRQIDACSMSTRTRARLISMAHAVNYLGATRRNITWETIRWENVRLFSEEWKALKAKVTAQDPVPPKFNGKQNSLYAYLKTLTDWLRGVNSDVTYTPMIYLIVNSLERDETSPENAPAVHPGRLYGGVAKNIEAGLVARHSKDTAAGKQDQTTLWTYMTKAFAGTFVAASAEQFKDQGEVDPIGWWQKINSTHADESHHESVHADAMNWIRTSKWDGKMPLPAYLQKGERQRDIMIAAAKQLAPDITLPLLSDRDLVKHLLFDGIERNDPELVAHKAEIKRQDRTGDDLRNNWKKASDYILKADYEGKDAKKGTKKARFQADISSAEGEPTRNVRQKGNGEELRINGKTRRETAVALTGGICPESGVDRRFYPKSQLDKLSAKQRTALFKWRNGELVKLGFPSQWRVGKAKGGAKVSAMQQVAKSLQATAEAMATSVASIAATAKGDNTSNEAKKVDAAIEALQTLRQGGEAVIKAVETEDIVEDSAAVSGEDEPATITLPDGTKVPCPIAIINALRKSGEKEDSESIPAAVAASAAVGLNSILKRGEAASVRSTPDS
jgi:hypothetical protein